VLFTALFSCGPKKGIVTKKQDQKEKVEVNSAPTSPVAVKEPPEEIPPENPVVVENKKVSRSGSAVENYIIDYADIAMMEMRKYKIPASITLAQGILESGSGNGRLARKANNHFGIKCHDWNGARIYHDDDRSKECFRKYRDPLDSYEDHSRFLTGRRRYAGLFDLKEDDYKGWARGLKKAGYATDRSYPKKLIDLIERYQLYAYDEEVLKGQKKARKKRNSSEELVATPVAETYVVQQGDTLYSLSQKFGTTIEEIKTLNNLKNNTISIGQTLKIRKN
jgi:flagellum-specific peptidoglycan hydrolase FlgJ